MTSLGNCLRARIFDEKLLSTNVQPHTASIAQLECAWHNIVESNQPTNNRIDCMHMLLPFLKNFSNSSIVTGETDKQSELKRMSCNTFFELSMYQCSTSSSTNSGTQAIALTQHARSICYDIKTKIKTDKKRNAQPTNQQAMGNMGRVSVTDKRQPPIDCSPFCYDIVCSCF